MSQDIISSKILRAMRDTAANARELLTLRTYRSEDYARIYSLEHDGPAAPIRMAVWDSRKRQLWVRPTPPRGEVDADSPPALRLANMFAGDLTRLAEIGRYFGTPLQLDDVPAERQPWQLPAHRTLSRADVTAAARDD